MQIYVNRRKSQDITTTSHGLLKTTYQSLSVVCCIVATNF